MYNAVPSQCCMSGFNDFLSTISGFNHLQHKVFAVCQDAATEYRHHNGGFGLLSPIAPVVHYYYKK